MCDAHADTSDVVTLNDVVGELPANVTESTGTVSFAAHGKDISLKYWKFENADAPAARRAVPLVCLHGGPSFSHGYLLGLRLLASSSGALSCFWVFILPQIGFLSIWDFSKESEHFLG